MYAIGITSKTIINKCPIFFISDTLICMLFSKKKSKFYIIKFVTSLVSFIKE